MFTGLGRTVLLVDDQETALSFYCDVLGFTVLYDQTAEGYRFLHIGIPGDGDAGLWLMPATNGDRDLIGRQAGKQPLFVLYTHDLDAVRRQLEQHGVRIWAERSDPGSRSLHFADLYGNAIVAAQLS